MENLKDSLISKKSVYNPVLGLANCLANFEYVAESKLSPASGDCVVSSVIPKSDLVSFDQDYWIENSIHIQEQDMYPLEINTLREVTKRDSVLFDLTGKPIKLISKNHYEIGLDEQKISIMMM